MEQLIRRVDVVPVHVFDQDAAVDFYTNRLEMKLIQDNDIGNGTRWITVRPDNAETAITLYKLPGHEPGQFPTGSNHPIVLLVDNMNSAYEQLLERGVEFSQPPFELGPGSKTAMFLDPDKNELILTDNQG